jgi:hypothetical protein
VQHSNIVAMQRKLNVMGLKYMTICKYTVEANRVVGCIIMHVQRHTQKAFKVK